MSTVELDLSTYGYLTTQETQVRRIYNNETANTGLSLESVEDFMDIDVGTTLSMSVTGDISVWSGGFYDANIDEYWDVNAGTTAAIRVGSDFLLDVENDVDFDIEGNMTSNVAGTMTLTSEGVMTLDANSNLIVDVEGIADIDVAGAVTIDTQSSIATTSATTTTISSTGVMTLDANSNLVVDVEGTADMDVVGNVTIDSSTGSISIGSDANTGAINIGNTSDRVINIGYLTSEINLIGDTVNIGTTGGVVEINDNTIIYGDLTVHGDSVEINAATVTVDDNNIVLNGITSPTDTNADNGGLTLKGTTDKTILYDKDCVSGEGSWSFNQNVNVDDTLGYYIDCKLALDETKLVIDATGTDEGIYFNGPVNAATPVAKDLRMKQVVVGDKTGIAIQQYDGAAWNTIWRVLGTTT